MAPDGKHQITVAQSARRLASALGDGPAAMLAASALIEADALGQSRFGIAMLQEWTAGCQPVAPLPEPASVTWRDCSAAFAPLAVAAATLEMTQVARRHGVAITFLRGVRGFGRLAPFVRHLADEGLIGIAGAEGPPIVAPHGGTRPVIGTNPLALAMGQGEARVVIDLASSAATMAALRQARATGVPLPEGVALDAQGLPTTLADAVAALLPRGGQVGSLLGLMVELIAGIAGGGRGDPAGRGVFVMAIDPAASGESGGLTERLAGLRNDWIACGGHWPRGGNLDPDTVMDAVFADRLAHHLRRLTEGGGEWYPH